MISQQGEGVALQRSTRMNANRSFGCELGADRRVIVHGVNAGSGIHVTDGLKKRGILVPVEACPYFHYQIFVGVLRKGDQRAQPWLAHPVENEHNSLTNFEGLLSSKLDELRYCWSSSRANDLEDRLSLKRGCHLVR